MNLTTAMTDRAIGALIGTACGDALGAGYEFKARVPYTQAIFMRGDSRFAPGEWTDDTAMAFAIAEVAAQRIDLRSAEAQDQIVQKWLEWSLDARDVGVQTGQVLRSMVEPTAAAARRAAAEQHVRSNGRSAGNGSLMRTAPVALAYLDDPQALAEAAMSISSLTHHDPTAGEACALWCLAIRDAIVTGQLRGPKVGLEYLPSDRQAFWLDIIETAETQQSWEFANNGWVVAAFQAAWSAIAHTPMPADRPELGIFPAMQFRAGVERAVRAGDDADTVGAIAGALLGARWGQSAVPSEWLTAIHGYKDATAETLVKLAISAVRPTSTSEWPHVERMATHGQSETLFTSRRVEGLFMGEQRALQVAQAPFDAVISLSRIGTKESPASHPHQLTVRIMDLKDPQDNLNLDFQYFDVSAHLHRWLGEGRSVFLHCVHTQNRTPSFFAAYLMYFLGMSFDDAMAEIQETLPLARPNGYLRERLQAIKPRNLADGGHIHDDLVLLCDDSVSPNVVYAEAGTAVLRRQGGVWIEVESHPAELRLASAGTVAAFDEREMARALR